jgi:hypothetical protein
LLRWAFLPALWLAAGCSGINASKSVSPLDFLVPGLLQADPAPAPPGGVPPAVQPVTQLAQN